MTITQLEALDDCCGFADCPCRRCRNKRLAVTAEHPDHDHAPTALSYCGTCRTAIAHKNDRRWTK